MKINSFIVLFSSAFILLGCATDADYNRFQEVMHGSPAAKQDVINMCYKNTSRASQSEAVRMAKIMNVSPNSNVPRTFCTRVLNAYASKRITHRDIRDETPAFIRVIQGQ